MERREEYLLPYDVVNKRVYAALNPPHRTYWFDVFKDMNDTYFYRDEYNSVRHPSSGSWVSVQQPYQLVGILYQLASSQCNDSFLHARVYDPFKNTNATKTLVVVNSKGYDVLTERIFNLVEILRMEILSKIKQ